MMAKFEVYDQCFETFKLKKNKIDSTIKTDKQYFDINDSLESLKFAKRIHSIVIRRGLRDCPLLLFQKLILVHHEITTFK